VALRLHSVNDVMLTHVLAHLQTKIVIRPHFGYRRMIDLERRNLLAEISGVSLDVDHIANAQGSAWLKLQVATDRWL
jgi:hypothetical protein